MIDRAVETLLGAYVVGPLGQGGEQERGYPEPVARALTYARETLARDPASAITLGDLAAAASVSPEHLCRVFRLALGSGPMETVRLVRLDMAIGLLARSNLNIEQVAYRCGFASAFHFSRRVRAVYGAPPSELRKRMEAGQAPPLSPLVKTGLMGV
jgi:transcriptional regulator GlxA family with amidase domain